MSTSDIYRTHAERYRADPGPARKPVPAPARDSLSQGSLRAIYRYRLPPHPRGVSGQPGGAGRLQTAFLRVYERGMQVIVYRGFDSGPCTKDRAREILAGWGVDPSTPEKRIL